MGAGATDVEPSDASGTGASDADLPDVDCPDATNWPGTTAGAEGFTDGEGVVNEVSFSSGSLLLPTV